MPDSDLRRTEDLEAARVFTIIIAANNEERYIGPCLAALIAQDDAAGPVEIVVAANACTDRTEDVVRSYEPQMIARGWRLVLLSSPEGGKVNALNRADRAAHGAMRAYLDADVICDPSLIGMLRAALGGDAPRYATGTLQVARAQSWVTRRYADLWTRLPFVKGGAVGAGLFAVNGAGRARWPDFPQIISDDTYVRLQFSPDERIELPACYHWPMVEGFKNLVRVRRRQDAGVAEVYRLYPALRQNEGKAGLGIRHLLDLIARAPVGFAIYMLVHLAVRVRRPATEWSRGR